MTCISASDSVSVVGDEEQSAYVLCSKTLGGDSMKPNNTYLLQSLLQDLEIFNKMP